jgi:hypothetical protein
VRRIVAEPAAGDEVLYRIVRAQEPAMDDFRGRRELPRRRPVSADTPWLLLAGVSMFETPTGALRIARRRPAWLAQIRLRAGAGIHFARGGTRGHVTVWGAPSILASCVERVDEAP